MTRTSNHRRPLGGGRGSRRGSGGRPATPPYDFGSSLTLNGTSQYAQSAGNCGITTGDFTMLVWCVANDPLDTSYKIVGHYGGTSGATGMAFGYTTAASGQREVACFDYSGTFITNSKIVMVAGKLYLLGLRRIGNNVEILVDGVSMATGTKALSIADGKFALGSRATTGAFYWPGSIYEGALWNRALDDAELLGVYANPATLASLSPLTHYDLDEGTGSTLNDSGSAGNDGATVGSPSWASAGTYTREDIAELCPIGDSITAGEVGNVGAYKPELFDLFIDTRKANYVGTLVTSYDTSFRYTQYHEGVSGQTIAQIAVRTCGTWTGSDFTRGSAGDPGVGNRGNLEDVSERPNGAGAGGRNGGIKLLIHWGTNDAASGAIDLDAAELAIKRMFAAHGAVAGVVWSLIIPRADNATYQTRIDTANAGIPAKAAALTAAGFPCVVADPVTGFDTGTMLQVDNVHPNPTGSAHMAAAWLAAL